MQQCPAHDDIVKGIEFLKNRPVITWPKFFGIMGAIITIAVTVTIAVTSAQANAIDRVESRSLQRSTDTALILKDYMDRYIIPMSKEISAINAKLEGRR
jgi:hypothetical protein